MSNREQAVPRPIKKAECTILFATGDAQVGWRDVLATRRNAVVDAWDFLTRHPLNTTPTTVHVIDVHTRHPNETK